MRKLIMLFSLLCMGVAFGQSPSLDAYGGRTDKACSATGAWYTTLVSNQWWLCTPAGHLMWGVGAYAVGPQVASPKYSGYQGLIATAQRLRAWGFNMLGPYANSNMMPYYSWMSGNQLPFLLGPIRAGNYGSFPCATVNSCSSPGVSSITGLSDNNLIKGMNNSSSPYWTRPFAHSGDTIDWADTARLNAANAFDLAAHVTNQANLDYVMGILDEDSDQTWGFGERLAVFLFLLMGHLIVARQLAGQGMGGSMLRLARPCNKPTEQKVLASFIRSIRRGTQRNTCTIGWWQNTAPSQTSIRLGVRVERTLHLIRRRLRTRVQA
jgi:hypothetical protein